MKRILVVLILFIGFSMLGMAQTATKPAKKEVDKTKVVPAKTAAVPAKTAKMTNSLVKTTTAPAAEKQKSATAAPVVLKKDGTPDKRYKTSKTPEGPLKKDGTPDKRYKSNKPAK